MSAAIGNPDIARIELMDWYDEMRERAFDARLSFAVMEKEATMRDNTPLPRGPFEEPSNAVEAPGLKAELANEVTRLADYRQHLQKISDAGLALHEELKATDLGKRFQHVSEELHEAKQFVKEIESRVRIVALAIHAETAERKPHDAVTIKRYNTPTITDEVLLLDHVRIHVPQCVKLDARQVTKLARAGLEFPYVEFEEEFRASIATRLDKWLPTENIDE